MKLRAAIRRMLLMRPEAWYIFLRALQLCCALLLGAVLLLIDWDGDVRGGFSLYQAALSFNEYAQLALLAAVIVPPCVEDWLEKKP